MMQQCDGVIMVVVGGIFLTRTTSVDSQKIINQLNRRLTQKYGPHFRPFTTKLVLLRDNVHFNDETYSGLSSEIETLQSRRQRQERTGSILIC